MPFGIRLGIAKMYIQYHMIRIRCVFLEMFVFGIFNNQQLSLHDDSDFMGMIDDTTTSSWNTPALDESLSEASTPRAEPQQHIEGNHQNRNSRDRTSSRSTDAVQKRREQNRISQMAHRQRSKKQVEDLRRQLETSTEYNHTMYHTLQTLGEKTQALAMEIQQALALQPPYQVHERSRTGSEELHWSPGSREDHQAPRQTKELVPPVGQAELPWTSGRYEYGADIRFNGFY
jgi:hypothetical protein